MTKNTITYGKFKDIKHEDLRIREVVKTVEQLQLELGYKCPKTSYYLKDTIISIQNKLKVAFKIYDIIDDDSLIFRDGNEIKAKVKNKTYSLYKMDYDFHAMTFDAMLNSKK